MDVTVLGASGSYGAPAGGACSGYLVRAGSTNLWVDCGNGTFPALQRHLAVDDLTAVVITHEHPDHCVDIYGLAVLLRWGRPERAGEMMPVYGPAGLAERLGTLVGGDWGGVLSWAEVDDGDEVAVADARLRFSRTDHPPPTVAVEVAHGGKRLVYTADTGPGWTVAAFGSGADLVLSEATFQRDSERDDLHLSARQAGEAARAAGARRLMLTHLWPGLDPAVSAAEGSEAFGGPVTLAAPHVRVRV
ncbi:MAG: MBL fold metallo-hydrolase [Acidimicrobiia bacterium]